MPRLLAIGDIHGHADAFDRLLDAIAPDPDDTFVALGDYVDRGPDSRNVIERLLRLRSETRLVTLIGNHEAMMLLSRRSDPALEAWLMCGGLATLQAYADPSDPELDLERIPEPHWEFLAECKLSFETGAHLFAHANVDPNAPLTEQSEDWLLWEKLRGPVRHVSGKMLVCGHTPQFGGLPLVHDSTLCLDTGVYLPHGWLTAADLTHGWCWQADRRGRFRQFALDEVETIRRDNP